VTTTPQADDDRQSVRLALAGLSAAWQEGRFDDLATYFHESAVMTPPGFNARAEGRDACAGSYRDFCTAARVTEYSQDEPAVDVWGDTAVATYGWTMAWEMGGRSYRESGHDVFVFSRDRSGGWKAVWRTLLSEPPAG
jgi:ketosteroid isomerase-like protein